MGVALILVGHHPREMDAEIEFGNLEVRLLNHTKIAGESLELGGRALLIGRLLGRAGQRDDLVPAREQAEGEMQANGPGRSADEVALGRVAAVGKA